MGSKELIRRISVAAAFVICPGDEIAAISAPKLLEVPPIVRPTAQCWKKIDP